MVCWTSLASKADLNTQSNQPQMELGRPRRGTGVVVEDRTVIKSNPLRQAKLQESTAQRQVVLGYE